MSDGFSISSVLYGSINIAQAAVPAGIGNLATALTGLDSLSNNLWNVCRPLSDQFVANGFFIKAETIAERNRVLYFLDPYANPKLIFGNLPFSCRGYIDNVTIRRIAEIVGHRCQ